MKTRLYIITFTAVSLVIFLTGYIGKDIALSYMQKKYIDLQLDVNKRQAETIAKFLEQQLADGATPDSVKVYLQNSLKGMDINSGFVCMFDKKAAQLVCHPEQKMIGMILPDAMSFDVNAEGDVQKTVNIIKSGVASGGLFETPNQTDIAFLTPVAGTDWVLASHENIAAIKQEVAIQQKIFFYGFVVLSLISAIFSTFMARLVGRRYERTIEVKNLELAEKNEELLQQKEEISAQSDEIQRQSFKIEQSNSQIVSSIRYAKRIQTALMPHSTVIGRTFSESFIFFKPRDIVSGDFYWFRRVGDEAVFAVADCTGHGVPGAMMSMLGIGFLNQIVAEDAALSASVILDRLRDVLRDSLATSESETENVKDGMDLALVIINLKSNELQFAGAYNPLVLIRNGELSEIEPDKMPVGTHAREDSPFTNKKLQLQKGDMLYLFSDGFSDQFGGPKNRKFMKKQFHELLLRIHTEQPESQKAKLEQEYESWRGKTEQVDDVSVAGLRIV